MPFPLQAVRVLWAPGAIFAVFCLAVCGGMLWVPETLGVELPQTVEELSAYYKKNRLSMSNIKQRFKKEEKQKQQDSNLKTDDSHRRSDPE